MSDKEERQRLFAQRWSELPTELKTGNQLAGKTIVACGATHHVMERCNFSCTCCYLGPQANQTKPLPFNEVCEQLDIMRAELGPFGKVQITAGEVTLLPLEDLGKIVAYALKIGLDPMVMSHGQRFAEEPEYLVSLVRDYGLRKVSIHIDTTQRGRKGIGRDVTELELNAVRDGFADLIRRVRKETGCELKVASTVTVTEGNLPELAEVTQWFFENADVFRLLSFLPVADVGRTRKSSGALSVERDALWSQIYHACGKSINRQPLLYGHEKCNNIVPVLLAQVGSERVVFEGVRKGNKQDEVMLEKAIDVIGPAIHWSDAWHRNALVLSRILTSNPSFMLQSIKYAFYRLWSERKAMRKLIQAMFSQKRVISLRPFLFVIHNFMSPADLKTEEGKKRLDACIFKLPVNGEMISMCEMNATDLRAKIDRDQLAKKNESSCGTTVRAGREPVMT